MKYIYLFLMTVLLVLSGCSGSRRSTKGNEALFTQDDGREFRGAWVQTAFQDRYQRMQPQQCKEYLERLVNTLYESGFNAIIFQVRPEGDAFYRSDIEPWSRFMTGVQGKAPKPVWDPMEYLIKLCHDRRMEFHAWINPYRMCASKGMKLPNHPLYKQHRDWFVRYDDRLYLNPGLPESRAYIREVVKDIVKRYDIDALHMDDYFYPYPVGGKTFDDGSAFQTYAPIMGFDVNDPASRGKFRRRNVDILIKSVSQDIKELKPWVRFGISPFGIYRNKKSWSGGSKTSGLQCYDDLYADVLLWAKSGWIDYVIPQLYWEMGHQAADYTTLCHWWAENIPAKCHLYIGQSIERSLDDPASTQPTPDLRKSHLHFDNKIKLTRQLPNVRGNCFWYAYQIEDNAYHVKDYLREHVHAHRVLAPAYKNLDAEVPCVVRDLDARLVRTPSRGLALHLSWKAPDAADARQQPRYYNVYRFAKGQRVNTKTADCLVAQVTRPEYYDFDIAGSARYTYVVTAVDYYNNEGPSAQKVFKIKVKP